MQISHNARYTLRDVLSVAEGEDVLVARETLGLLRERRRQVTDYVQSTNQPAYGFNRGFGHLVNVPVPEDRLAELQENLIRSHASGVGEYAPRQVTRAAMFLRAASLARGHSGVRPVVVETLASMLTKGVTPCVPVFGSVGASGDLAPLSHIALVMLGGGEAWYRDDPTVLSGDEAMKRAGVGTIQLEMKEGLALNNGAQFSTALGVLAYWRLLRLLKTAALATAMSTQVMLGADTPFDSRLHALRGHPGATTVAEWIWQLMQSSPIREAHRAYDVDGEIQDPYNIRCAAQVLGACHDLLDEARVTFEIEINSVTDNPVILPDADLRYTTIVSGGHFHGMPVAVKIYNLIQAAAIMSALSNVRCARYVDGKRNKGLNDDLKWPDPEKDAVSCGMMIPEYVSAALTNVIWGAAMPTHLMSISTDAGQEDHVSMSAGLAVRLWGLLPRLAEVLAIELAFAAQGAAIRRQLDHIPSKKTLSVDENAAVKGEREAFTGAVAARLSQPGRSFEVEADVRVKYPLRPSERVLSPACEAALKTIATAFPTVTEDRYMSPDLRKLADLVSSGAILDVAEAVVPLSDAYTPEVGAGYREVAPGSDEPTGSYRKPL